MSELIHARFRLPRGAFTLDVDLELPGRGVTALFGPSGSGKTTLLRCLAGLERAPGRLIVAGDTWQDARTFLPPHRRPLGYVFQDARLFPHLTVAGNLAFAQRRAVSATVDMDAIIRLLDIAPLMARHPIKLSGGETQRVAIARALAVGPQLLLLDEPLAALDYAKKRELLPYLEALHETLALPLIYVSHAPDEVARLADHLVLMDAGRATASGPLAPTLARLDPALPLGEDVGVVLAARVVERDPAWHLMRATFDGGELWLADNGHALEKPLRVRVLARDVSLTLEQQSGSSIVNSLAAEVEELAADTHPAQLLVRLQVGAPSTSSARSPLLARITRKSASALDLQPGKRLWAQVKTAALLG